MENTLVTAPVFGRLLKRMGGSYLFWINFICLLISDLSAVIGIYYIISATDLLIDQVFLLVLCAGGFSLLANLLISLYGFLSTKNAREYLDMEFKNTNKGQMDSGTSNNVIRWLEIYTLPGRTVIITIVTLVLLVVLPSLITLRLVININLNLNQIIHILLGLLISITSIVILHSLLLERVLEPVRQFLFSPEAGSFKPHTLSRIATRLFGIIVFLVISTIIVLAGIGFQRSINASLPGANLPFEIAQFQKQAAILGLMILVFGILLGKMNASSISRPIRDLLKVLNIATEGIYLQSAKVISSDETSQLASQLNILFTKLQVSTTNLEKLAEERTEKLNQRTNQLLTMTKIIQEISNSPGISKLMEQAVQLISDKFGYYHVGLFLTDINNEYAKLHASSSEGGKLMIARGYKCEINKNNLIGRAIIENRTIIIRDTLQDLSYQVNPDLPQTNSLMIIPLISRGTPLGALDIQASTASTFSAEEQDLLQTLADQITITVSNLNLIEENQLALQRLESSQEENIRNAWREFGQENKPAYRYTSAGLEKIDGSHEGNVRSEGQKVLGVPILVHGQKIGSIEVIKNGQTAWDEQDSAFLSDISSQVGLALENSRMLNSTQQRVYYEQSLSDLTSRLGLSIDTDTLLETAIRELHQLPNVTEVSVKLAPPDETKPVEIESPTATEA